MARFLSQWSYKTAVILCLFVWIYFFYETIFKKRLAISGSRDERLFLLLLVFSGTLVRLMVSIEGYGNYDSVSWEQVGDILARGENVFNHTTRYNTSPVWFWILGALKKISAIFTCISYRSWVRVFLSVVDLVTLGVLWRKAGHFAMPRSALAVLFYLNPVSILSSSYHAQFENLAILFLLVGIAVFLSGSADSRRHKWISWAWVTLGLVTKHNICYEIPIFLRFIYSKFQKWVLWFALSCLTFFAFFLPYWQESHEAIIKNVWLYGSYPMKYGVSTFGGWQHAKYIFLAALFLYAFVQRSRDLVIRCLQGVLFFLTFTPGFGHQYLALPVALGALRPSRAYFLFTTIASLAIMGSDRNIYIKTLSWIPLNTVWLAVLVWFISIHTQAAQSAGSLGGSVHSSKKDSRPDKIN